MNEGRKEESRKDGGRKPLFGISISYRRDKAGAPERSGFADAKEPPSLKAALSFFAGIDPTGAARDLEGLRSPPIV